MTEPKIKTIGDLKKAIRQLMINPPRNQVETCRNEGLVMALEKIGEVEKNSQKPVERGKQALDFLLWLMREVEAEYPKSSRLLESLEATRLDLQTFVLLNDTKKILGDGKSGE